MCACWYRKRSIRFHMLSPPHIVIPVLFERNNIPFHPSLMFFSTWVAPKIMATSQHSYIHFRSRKRRNIKKDLQLPDLEPVWRPWVNGEQCHLTKGSWYIYIYIYIYILYIYIYILQIRECPWIFEGFAGWWNIMPHEEILVICPDWWCSTW